MIEVENAVYGALTAENHALKAKIKKCEKVLLSALGDGRLRGKVIVREIWVNVEEVEQALTKHRGRRVSKREVEEVYDELDKQLRISSWDPLVRKEGHIVCVNENDKVLKVQYTIKSATCLPFHYSTCHH